MPPLRRFAVDGPIHAMAWSPDGSRIALARDHHVEVYTAEGIRLWDRPSTVAGRVEQLVWSPDGLHALADGAYHSFTPLGAMRAAPMPTGAPARCTPDGRRVVSARGPEVTLWPPRAGRRQRDADGAVAAGRAAELHVARELDARLAGTGCALHAGRRVPDLVNERRRELDFVLTRPGDAVLIEVKNWTGALHVDDAGHFVQQRRNGEALDHGPVLADLIEKGRVLRRVLRARSGQDLPVHPIVALFNARLRISGRFDPERVMTWGALQGTLPDGRPTSLRELLWALVLRLVGTAGRGGTAPAPSPAVRALRSLLDALGTWDQVHLHGGRMLVGDLLQGANDQLFPWLDLSTRSEVAAVEVDVTRSLLGALVRRQIGRVRIIGRSGRSLRLDGLPRRPLLIREAGQSEATEVDWPRITRVEVGYTDESRYMLPWSLIRPGLEVDGIVRQILDHALLVDIGAPSWGRLHIRNIDRRFTHPDELPTRFEVGSPLRVVVLGAEPDERRIELHRASS